MAITKIQAGALPADVITTAAIDDASITHAKLHTTMDLSSKTVTLPSAITDTITNKLPLAGGTLTGTLNVTQASTADTIKLTRGTTAHNNMIKFVTGSTDKWIVGQRNDSTDHFRFYSYGTSSDVLSIQTDGKVGIGLTSNFGSKFHVNSEMSLGPDNNNRMIIGSTSGGIGSIGTLQGGTTSFSTMTFNGGNVGIGTNSPTTRLSFGNYIPSNGQTIHTYEDGNTVSGLGIVAGVHRMFTNNGASLSYGHVSSSDGSTYTEAMRIDASGNVGIGTSSPADSAWYTASGANTEVAIDGNSGYGVMHFRGTGAGSTDTQYTQGVGDSKFYMAYDSVTNLHRMTIEPSGAIITPTQPAFVATTTASSDLTTRAIIPYNNNLYDRATNFNTANHRFTAPVTGLYTFTTYHWHKSNTGGFTYLFLFLNGSINFEFRNTRASSHSEYNRVGFTTTLAMSANDYVHVEGAGSGGGELHTSANSQYSHFSGYLIG